MENNEKKEFQNRAYAQLFHVSWKPQSACSFAMNTNPVQCCNGNNFYNMLMPESRSLFFPREEITLGRVGHFVGLQPCLELAFYFYLLNIKHLSN